ncbi:MAG: ubiquinol-cytochrome C chaperone family protein [Alphaproteobacteria bacterium]|nr:ubiquinol-cytochrome C chaperone family protein [Alphaproteobacteria bacterium]
MRTLFSFFTRGPDRSRHGAWIYNALVEQSRREQFYAAMEVPDTIDGRFDLIVLHAGLYLPRLKSVRTDGKQLAQATFDQMFANMEQNLRELGNGDMTVPKKMQGMVQAFYGRAMAYENALKGGDVAALRAALHRNVYRGAEVSTTHLDALATYVRAASEALQAAEDNDIVSGTFAWPAP